MSFLSTTGLISLSAIQLHRNTKSTTAKDITFSSSGGHVTASRPISASELRDWFREYANIGAESEDYAFPDSGDQISLQNFRGNTIFTVEVQVENETINGTSEGRPYWSTNDGQLRIKATGGTGNYSFQLVQSTTGSVDLNTGTTAAEGTAVLQDDGVISITITNNGGGYTSTPSIDITHTGSAPSVPAEFTATILNGQVQTVTRVASGDGYDAVPTVTFTGGLTDDLDTSSLNYNQTNTTTENTWSTFTGLGGADKYTAGEYYSGNTDPSESLRYTMVCKDLGTNSNFAFYVVVGVDPSSSSYVNDNHKSRIYTSTSSGGLDVSDNKVSVGDFPSQSTSTWSGSLYMHSGAGDGGAEQDLTYGA